MEYREIILAKIASIFSKGYFIVKQNGEMKRILKCCGLGEFYENNSQYLEPYRYNNYKGKVYENLNDEFNLFIGLDYIFTELYNRNKTESILKLLKEIAENFNPYLLEQIYQEEKYEKQFKELNNLYELLGLSINIENDIVNVNHMVQRSESRIEDIFSVEEWLFKNYLEVYKSYEGAIIAYKNGNYGTCIEACRTTLTGLFSKFKGTEDFAKWLRGISNISNEINGKDIKELKQNMDKLNKKELADFFGENIEGEFKKTRAIYMIYSMMSDYGTHRQENVVEQPTEEDALMMLRMTEDILIWIFMRVNK